MTNPLLEPWDTPFGLPPFDLIDDTHFEPAVEAALTAGRAAFSQIAENSEDPTFDNTIRALEATRPALTKVLSPFYAIAGTMATPERDRIQRKFSPMLADYTSELFANRMLFDRIESLWTDRDGLDLNDEDMRVLTLTRQDFLRAGAQLEGEQAGRMKAIKSRLATLGTEFVQNIVADEKDWSLALPDTDMDGLPDFLRDGLKAAGEEREADGPVLTLSRSLIVPFLQFSSRRDLREVAWRAWTSRGATGGETDNRAIAAEILSLRSERAKLLGYPDFASYKLEPEMAKTPNAVEDLLMAVWAPAKAQAHSDAEILTAMLKADGLDGPLEPWDWRYYSEKRRKAEHDLDEAELKPYFQLDRMIEAAFDCATKLFGLAFTPVDAPLYHPDCRAFEVTRDGAHVALFIGDYFARAGKRSGAWCSAMRTQNRLEGDVRPHVINVCNFAKPLEGSAALLSYDDARTLFHEFGHALHQMLSDVTYERIAGTWVARDFVELPSQLYEHWLEVPEVLSEFATHAATGEPMPDALRERVIAAATYDMGFQTVEYVASALVDLDFHVGEPPTDPMQRQAEVLERIGLPSAIPMRHATPHFAHVFAGDGYSAGYYSYMWSEVMDADAFAAFEEAGDAFDPGRAKALEDHILSRGGSEDAEALYLKFRGRMPGVDALLKGRGLAA